MISHIYNQKIPFLCPPQVQLGPNLVFIRKMIGNVHSTVHIHCTVLHYCLIRILLPNLQEPSQDLCSLVLSIFLLTQPLLIGVGRPFPLALNPLPNERTFAFSFRSGDYSHLNRLICPKELWGCCPRFDCPPSRQTRRQESSIFSCLSYAYFQILSVAQVKCLWNYA